MSVVCWMVNPSELVVNPLEPLIELMLEGNYITLRCYHLCNATLN